MRLCKPCFRRLPFPQRQAIARAGEDKAPHLVAALAAEAAEWLKRNPEHQGPCGARADGGAPEEEAAE
jgi:hypothetical protein